MSTRKRPFKKKFSFYETWERVKKETPLSNFRQLAEIVETSGSNITKRKNEDAFPIEWAFMIGMEYEISTEWLLTGEKPKNRGETERKRKFTILDEIEVWLEEETRKNPKHEPWFEIQMQELFPKFKVWKERKEGKVEKSEIAQLSKIA